MNPLCWELLFSTNHREMVEIQLNKVTARGFNNIVMILTDKLKQQLESQGYCYIKEIPNRGICAIMKFMFTYGLCYGIDNTGYKGRYCYPHEKVEDAILALHKWNGESDPDGDWIKHKGKTEYSNPNRL
jgi:hypothetical protein